MHSPICEMFGIDFPLLAFSHCRNVVVEVSKAGGMGVFGAGAMTPDALDTELKWIDENIDGKPYGVDLLVPAKSALDDNTPSAEQILAMIPDQHKKYAAQILAQYGIDASDLTDEARLGYAQFGQNIQSDGVERLLDVAFSYPIKLIVNALGVPPKPMLDRGKAQGVKVGALVGAKEHAIRQVQAGVDVLVVSGTEGGGHCGSVSTLVLIPEVFEAIQPYGNVPILAAGGIVTGRQMAACMTMGAAGAWTASMWLTTAEAETLPAVKDKMVDASSADTVRSKSRTGKFSRQLRSPWTDAWEAPESPGSLPMPLQSMVSEPALAKIDKLADGGHEGAKELATYWVGQGVGLMSSQQSVRSVMVEFMEDFLAGYDRLCGYLGSK